MFPDVRVVLVGETLTVITEPAGFTETLALAFFVVFALLVAVIVTFVDVVTVGAVKRPLLETEPADADHVTAVLLVPCTLALNCCVFPEVTLALLGDIATLMIGGATFTTALAFLVVSAALVAVTVTFVLLLTLGAVKSPLAEIAPPVEDQVTPVFDAPVTVALNCWEPPGIRLVLNGETAIFTVPAELFTTVICGWIVANLPVASVALIQK